MALPAYYLNTPILDMAQSSQLAQKKNIFFCKFPIMLEKKRGICGGYHQFRLGSNLTPHFENQSSFEL